MSPEAIQVAKGAIWQDAIAPLPRTHADLQRMANVFCAVEASWLPVA
jgi:hypothetical protein